MTTATKPPVKEIRQGRIKAVIWENETQNGTRYSTTIRRLYKGDDDRWHESESLGREDLLLAARVLEKAHDAIFELGNKES